MGKNMVWTHPDYPGVTIKHCGHPTALRPYHIPGCGAATFRRLKQAQWWVEHGGHELGSEQEKDRLYREMVALETGWDVGGYWVCEGHDGGRLVR